MKIERTSLALAKPEPQAASKPNPALDRACREFEGVFVRQLLTAAKMGEQAGKSGYGPMVVDAMASAIADGGGLGLAGKIREALDGVTRRG